MSQHRRFSIRLIALALLLAGCAGPSKPPRQGSASLAGIDSKLSARENLARLAAREIPQTQPQSSAVATPTGAQRAPAVPPGIEPAVLTPRDSADPKAFLSLPDALQFFAQADLDDDALAPATQPQVDPEARVQALKLYAKARSAALDGRNLQAIVDLQKACELDPTSPEILRELARCHLAENRTAQAVEVYQRLIRLAPDHSEALFTLGLAAANRRDFARAVMALGRLKAQDKFTPRDPATDVLVDFTLATAFRELGYDRAAIDAATESLNLPDNLAGAEHAARLGSIYRQRGETWRGIGDAHCRLRQYTQALQAYANSAQLPTADPSALHPRVIYANLCLGRQFTAQLESLNVLEAQPKAISERDIRLCAYLGENARPIDLLAQAVGALYRANPDESSCVRAAASLLAPPQARDLLKEFVARRPRDLQGVAQLLAWVAQQDVTAAADLAVVLVAEHPDLAAAYSDRLALAAPRPAAALAAVQSVPASAARARVEIRLLSRRGGLGEAWFVCRGARAQWPDDRGLMLQELQLAAALQESALFERALAAAHGLDDVPSLIGLSQARRALGQMDAAIRLAQQAVDQEPQNVEALVELARAHGALAATLADDSELRVEFNAAIDAAVRSAEQAIKLAPDRDDPYEVLSLIYMPGGALADTQLFRQTAQRLREASPQSPLYARLAAQEAISQRRYEQALDRLVNLSDSDAFDSASLSLAVSAWQQWGKLDAAEQWLNERLTQRPGDPNLLEQWVRVQLLQDRTGAVIARLEQAVRDDGSDYLARRLLETVYRATGKVDAALELGEQRLLARPQGMRREVELAALYGGAQLAEKAFDRLAWIQQHVADADLDDLTSAIAIAGRIPGDDGRREPLTLDLVRLTIARYPTASVQVYGSGLRALARAGRLDESFDALADQTVANARGAREPSLRSAVTWRELAQALVDDGQPASAARAVRARLRAADPLDGRALTLLVRVALVADAAAEVADSKPDHAEQSLQLIRDLERRGDLEEAFDSKQRVSLNDAIFEASSLYSVIGGKAGAERLLREVIKLDPDRAMALNNLGYSLLEAGRRDEQTLRFIERAYELEPHDSNILDTVGWLRYKQGRFGDEPGATPQAEPNPGALALIQRSISQNPGTGPEVMDHLGDAQWRLGNADKAAEAWRAVVKMLGDERFQQVVTRNLQLEQLQVWHLLVVDPRTMYDREYGVVLKRARQKLAALEQGGRPAVAPTFDELPR